MATRGEKVARAAHDLVGAPFRLHGRGAQTGLDCVGLVALALRAAGCPVGAPESYSVRGGRVELVDVLLRAAGLRRVAREKTGDIVLVRSGVAQLHLMIAVAGGHVHADAGLGSIVEMPGPSPWPVIGRWRWGR